MKQKDKRKLFNELMKQPHSWLVNRLVELECTKESPTNKCKACQSN